MRSPHSLILLFLVLTACVSGPIPPLPEPPPVYEKAVMFGTGNTLGDWIASANPDYVVLTYWQSSCPRCKVQLALWDLNHSMLRDAGIEVVAVNYGGVDVEMGPMGLPIAVVAKTDVHVLGVPATIILTKDYEILREVYGLITIEQLLTFIGGGP